MNKKKKIVLSITLAALLVGGVLLANNWVGQVYASSGTTTFTDAALLFGPGGTGEDLAEALGITAEELDAAQEEAFLSAIDTALKAEYITDSQAESLKAGNGGFRSLFRYLSENERSEFDQAAYLAEALGISGEELEAAYDAIRQARIDELIADGIITQDQADLRVAFLALRESTTFQANMKQAMTDAINSEVEAGTLTQAQADLLIASLEDLPAGFAIGMRGSIGIEDFSPMGGIRRPGRK